MEQFKIDIDSGLSAVPKTLPSKYFYDKIGDDLFVQIMDLPEYYLTRSELEIFTTQTQQIIDALEVKPDTYFELIELGAGDGLKTKKLLEALDKQHYKFDFFPVDISQNALDTLEDRLKTELPTISVKKKQGDYFQILASLKNTHHPKVVLFLGSNMGNMTDATATDFIYELSKNLCENDKLLLGVDLMKPASIVLPAYNDSAGITRQFNLNLLHRINQELDGNFLVESFSHIPEYTEEEGIARSFLVSNSKQTVELKKLNKTFEFEKGEKIATEISRKYNDKIIQKIIQGADFSITQKLTDSKEYFVNYILTRGKNEG
ncbi:MAG: L-histidine N(Alpha)-methyltransferase [uncultured Aureispira sp.]|uniref:L-histidine N(Alpha)-methyltransferase n=1 Tax=uncultured Aureispira sp. TaxID=1331704 RepID=A0A6S6TD23_9BACT|nr:MAG: L-histidine N(Alpha)-methyltransferase [uncultured Aureispira sp.]